jgi:hypothetical protein
MVAIPFLLVAGACGDGGAPGETPGPDAGPRPLGTVTGLGGAPCPAGAVPGASCQTIRVSCPGIEDVTAVVGTTTPAGDPAGTVVLHSGGGGVVFDFQGGNGTRFGDDLARAGYRIVQIAWSSPWEQTLTSGILAAACRPASVFRWAFTDRHDGDRRRGYCALGSSAGSAALSYSLAHYGLGDTFDSVQLVAGPPFGRIDYGCAPETYGGPPRDLCPELRDAPIAYDASEAEFVGAAENTPAVCGTAAPPPADVGKWAGDSVVSPGASYSYPSTAMHFYYCATRPNATTGLGSFYVEAITSPRSVLCGTRCADEGAMDDPAIYAAMLADAKASCIPRH